MIKSSTLFQRLTQRVHQLYTQYAEQPEKKIHATFDSRLFSENNQSFDFYLAQIEQTLAQISHLQAENTDNLDFLSQKLLAQCTALSDALSDPKSSKSAVNFKPVLSEREKRLQALQRLPPRERLSKYYEALQALNEKISMQEDLLQNSRFPQEKADYANQIKTTQQRRIRCLEAIEMLEEYLSLTEQRD